MVAFNFKDRFVLKILGGTKVQTIRKTKRCEIGDTMHLFVGQRTKDCKLLGKRRCIASHKVEIYDDYIVFPSEIGKRGVIVRDKFHLNSFARLDGFANAEEMFSFFKEIHDLPFTGHVHGWNFKPLNKEYNYDTFKYLTARGRVKPSRICN